MEQVMTATRSPSLAALLAAYGPRPAGRALADDCGYDVLERAPWATWPVDTNHQGPDDDDEDEDEGDGEGGGEDDIATGAGTAVCLVPSPTGRRSRRRP
jgi:hypothetical protein